MGRWIRKVLRVDAVERFEIAVHVDQKHCDVKQFLPAAPVCIQNGFDIGKNAVDLGFKIKFHKVAIVIERKPGHPLSWPSLPATRGPTPLKKSKFPALRAKG